MTPVLGVVKADIFETKDCILHQSIDHGDATTDQLPGPDSVEALGK